MINKLIVGILICFVFIFDNSLAMEKSVPAVAAKNMLEIGMGNSIYKVKQDVFFKDLFKKDVWGFKFSAGYERKLIPLMGVNFQFSRIYIFNGKIFNALLGARIYLINRKAEMPIMRLFIGIQAGCEWINATKRVANFRGVGNHMEASINCRTRLSDNLYMIPRVSFFTGSYKKQRYTDSQGISGDSNLNMNGYSYEVILGYAF